MTFDTAINEAVIWLQRKAMSLALRLDIGHTGPRRDRLRACEKTSMRWCCCADAAPGSRAEVRLMRTTTMYYNCTLHCLFFICLFYFSFANCTSWAENRVRPLHNPCFALLLLLCCAADL